MKFDVFVNSPESRYYEIVADSKDEAKQKAILLYYNSLKYDIKEQEEDTEEDYCNGCEHLKYEADTNASYCDLDKSPKLNEEKKFQCESREEGETYGEHYNGKEE